MHKIQINCSYFKTQRVINNALPNSYSINLSSFKCKKKIKRETKKKENKLEKPLQSERCSTNRVELLWILKHTFFTCELIVVMTWSISFWWLQTCGSWILTLVMYMYMLRAGRILIKLSVNSLDVRFWIKMKNELNEL